MTNKLQKIIIKNEIKRKLIQLQLPNNNNEKKNIV